MTAELLGTKTEATHNFASETWLPGPAVLIGSGSHTDGIVLYWQMTRRGSGPSSAGSDSSWLPVIRFWPVHRLTGWHPHRTAWGTKVPRPRARRQVPGS